MLCFRLLCWSACIAVGDVACVLPRLSFSSVSPLVHFPVGRGGLFFRCFAVGVAGCGGVAVSLCRRNNGCCCWLLSLCLASFPSVSVLVSLSALVLMYFSICLSIDIPDCLSFLRSCFAGAVLYCEY